MTDECPPRLPPPPIIPSCGTCGGPLKPSMYPPTAGEFGLHSDAECMLNLLCKILGVLEDIKRRTPT